MLQRVVQQLGVVLEAHFLQDAAAVSADGFDAKTTAISNSFAKI